LDAAGKYGSVAAGFSNVLEALTRPDNSVVEALINALNVAKGAVTNSTQHTTGTTTTSGTTTNNQNSSSQSNTAQNQSGTLIRMANPYGENASAGAGAATLTPTNVQSQQSTYYSPSAWENVTPQQLAASLAPSVWDNYSF
jgi:transcription elongation factor